MNTSYILNLKYNLNELYTKGVFDNKKIVLFADNHASQKTYSFLLSHDIKPVAIIDNNKKKWGKKAYGIEISAPKKLLKNASEDMIILVGHPSFVDICEQVAKWGFRKDLNLFETIKYKNDKINEIDFDDSVNNLRNGYLVWQKILKSRNINECKILVCPYAALGDAYLIASYLESYIKNNRIVEYIITVVSDKSKAIMALFDIKNIILITQKESDDLVSLYRLVGEEESHISFMFDCLYTDITYRLSKGGRSWGDVFLPSILDSSTADVKYPRKTQNHAYSKNYFKENGLIQNKTAILSPYANGWYITEYSIWEKISDILKRKGYIVCTNCADEYEAPIRGTKPLLFSVEYAVEIIEEAGLFIGLRSGLCDLISNAKCTKIIVYLNKGSMFLNLKALGVSNDAVEIEIKNLKRTVTKMLNVKQ